MRAVRSATLRAQLLTEGGTLRVSVLAGRDECVFGRRLVGGREQPLTSTPGLSYLIPADDLLH